jgi:hypothetical protein
LITPEENLAYAEGIVDVGAIVQSYFENPLKEQSISLLADAISRRRRLVIPVTEIIGAYHIATKYLGVPRLAAKS